MAHVSGGIMEALSHKRVRETIGGVLMLLLGIASAWGGSRYSIGTLSRMGPGFFPLALGLILAATGIVLIALAWVAAPEAPRKLLPPEWRGWLCIVLAVIAFGVIGRHGGLVPATFATVFIAALGERQNSLKNAVLLGLLMVAFCLLVFIWGLQIQFPLFTWGGA
jgi:hypothetical protein